MPFNLNRVELIDRHGRDPELRYTAEGHAVAKFSLATDRWVKGDGPAETDWHQIICWRGLAEFCWRVPHQGTICLRGRAPHLPDLGGEGRAEAPRDLGGDIEGDVLPF